MVNPSWLDSLLEDAFYIVKSWVQQEQYITPSASSLNK